MAYKSRHAGWHDHACHVLEELQLLPLLAVVLHRVCEALQADACVALDDALQ